MLGLQIQSHKLRLKTKVPTPFICEASLFFYFQEQNNTFRSEYFVTFSPNINPIAISECNLNLVRKYYQIFPFKSFLNWTSSFSLPHITRFLQFTSRIRIFFLHIRTHNNSGFEYTSILFLDTYLFSELLLLNLIVISDNEAFRLDYLPSNCEEFFVNDDHSNGRHNRFSTFEVPSTIYSKIINSYKMDEK